MFCNYFRKDEIEREKEKERGKEGKRNRERNEIRGEEMLLITAFCLN